MNIGGLSNIAPVIHTMKDDLQEIINPNSRTTSENFKKIETPIAAAKPALRVEKKGSNPFFSKNKWGRKGAERPKAAKAPQNEFESPFKSEIMPAERIETARPVMVTQAEPKPIQEEKKAPVRKLERSVRPLMMPQTIPSFKNDEREAGPQMPLQVNQNSKKGIVIPIKKGNRSPFNRIKEIRPAEGHHGLGKVIFSAFVIALILFLIAGGYYFWMNRDNYGDIVEKFDLISKISPEPVETMPSFSETNPNNLSLDVDNSTKINLPSALREYVDKIAEQQIVTPVAFIIKDSTNAPVPFSVFAEKSGIVLGKEIMNQLGDDFTVFIYNDGQYTRLGLSVSATSEDRLKEILQKEEMRLIAGLQPLFMDVPPKEAGTKFGTGNFNGITVHYFTINAVEGMSLDYAVTGGQLVIGTSKMTLRAILDRSSSSFPLETTSN